VSDRAETLARVLRLEPGRTGLLVVDMQHGFVHPGEALEVPPAREIVPAIGALVDGFRARRLPVLFTEFTYSPAVPLLVGELHPEHRPAVAGAPRGFGHPSSNCLEGTDSARTIDALAPRPDEPVIRKRWYDAFAGTELDGALRAHGATALVITGTMTDICVLSTVVGGSTASTASRSSKTPWPRCGRRSSGRPSSSGGGPSAVSYHRRKSSTPSPAGKESHDA
jgi:nicotinamidase-related amidase